MKARPTVIDTLIKQGTDIHAKATDRATPLHYAVMARHLDAVKCLLLADKSLEFNPDDPEVTPLYVAILEEGLDIIACIIAYAVRGHECQKNENTAPLKSKR